MTPKELEAIKRRCEAATPGPWFGPRLSDDWPPGWVAVYAAYESGEPIPFAVIGICGRFEEESINENAEFIAHSITDIPALVAEVEKLRELEPLLTHAGIVKAQEDHNKLREERDRLVAEVERLRGLLRDVGNTLVEAGRHESTIKRIREATGDEW
jgi:hypothetical protein